MAAEPTARDALIAEMLGDVGRLHDKITELPDALKAAVAPTVGAIVAATKEAQTTIAQLGAAEKASIGQFTAAEKIALRDALKAAMREEAGAALVDAVRTLNNAAKTHDDAVKDAASKESRQVVKTMAMAAAFGLLGALCGIAGGYVMYGQPQAQQAAVGRAVSAAWGQLDAKAQAVIQRAREAQQ